jgi:hypothetical protein
MRGRTTIILQLGAIQLHLLRRDRRESLYDDGEISGINARSRTDALTLREVVRQQ